GVRRCRRTSSTDPTPRNRPTVRSESGTQPEATASAISEGALHLAVGRPFGCDRPEAFRTAVIGPKRSGVRRTALRGEASVAQGGGECRSGESGEERPELDDDEGEDDKRPMHEMCEDLMAEDGAGRVTDRNVSEHHE